ncbi:helicase POLQ-like [Uloborus diversus]|uniref:helicase POLQ-like n=1 Tax=Uloborus diversus TaxID=327109 RepID=UPI00240A10C1|nr:helicase POLQ-like [Uloborus diversus]
MMNNSSFSALNDDSEFSIFTSTPVSRKSFRRCNNNESILNPCSITYEFLGDDDLFENICANDLNGKPDCVALETVCKNDDFSEKVKIKEKENAIQSKPVADVNNSLICHSQHPETSLLSQNKRRGSSSWHNCSFPSLSLNSILNEDSPDGSDSFTSHIIKKLKHNASTGPKSPKSSLSQIKRASILFALDEAQKLHEQLSQSSVGPFYGLPSTLPDLLRTHKGIDELYVWQQECLTLPAVKQKQNLIYSLPTSGGKTLVAEILIMRELLCHLKDAVLVLPYISLVQEKVRGLSPFAVDLDFVIEECAGIKGTIPPRKRRKRHVLYICTIEKAHSLINSLIENHRMPEIGLIVVDELHMIGESGGRGAILEALLSKILFVSRSTQIIGMSATLSNMADLQKFLNADVYEKDFRPIELKEYVKVGSELYELTNKNANEWHLSRTLNYGYSKEKALRDPDMITGLIMEVIPQNSCLIFCPTKKHCENVAITVCHLLPESLLEHKKAEKEAFLSALSEEGHGNVCNILKQSVKFGIAYHHSGLTMDERKLIEEAYLNGILCCLTCTSTLAAGVNLPAKRVILRAPYVGRDFITFSRYKQMVGRAGRAGIDSSGESILIIKPSERLHIANLLTSDMDSCQSTFNTEPDRLHMLLLGLVGLNLAHNLADVYSFMNNTLSAVQTRDSGCSPSEVFQKTMNNLCDNGLMVKDNDKFFISDLGKAAFRGGVDIATAEEFLKRLRNGMNGLVLHSYLHLLYITTPVEFSQSIPLIPDILLEKYSSLSSEDMIVAEQIGVTERLVMLLASGRNSNAKNKALLHHFYLTLILYDLWKQNSVWSVAQEYQVHRGVIQNMLNSASALGAIMSNFCQELPEFWAYQQLLPSFVKQLSYCVTMELIPLMELPAVKRGRAKQLYIAGFKTLAHIARVNPHDLVNKVNHLPYKTAAQIVSAAKMILTEKAEALHEEAEQLIEEFDQNCSMFNDIDL